MTGNDDLEEATGPANAAAAETRPVRRVGGMRSPVSESVVFRAGDRKIDGWTLNISQGGLRAIVNDGMQVGEEFEFLMGEAEPRAVRIVWVRAEKDGAIVGVSFLDNDGSVPPPPKALAAEANEPDETSNGN